MLRRHFFTQLSAWTACSNCCDEAMIDLCWGLPWCTSVASSSQPKKPNNFSSLSCKLVNAGSLVFIIASDLNAGSTSVMSCAWPTDMSYSVYRRHLRRAVLILCGRLQTSGEPLIVESCFSTILRLLIRNPIGCCQPKQVINLSAIVLALRSAHRDDLLLVGFNVASCFLMR